MCLQKASTSDMIYEEITERCDKALQLAYKDISLNCDATGKAKQKQNQIVFSSKKASAHRRYYTHFIDVITFR